MIAIMINIVFIAHPEANAPRNTSKSGVSSRLSTAGGSCRTKNRSSTSMVASSGNELRNSGMRKRGADVSISASISAGPSALRMRPGCARAEYKENKKEKIGRKNDF